MNERQTARARSVSPEWLHEHDRKFLFELLVPAEPAQLEQVGGDTDRFDAELRPELMRRTIETLQEPAWRRTSGRSRASTPGRTASGSPGPPAARGRDGVVCVVLGRGANDEKVEHWLRQGAPVDGYAGFAIGRTIWWDALKGFLDGSIERDAAARADRRQVPAFRARVRGGRAGAAATA